MSSQCVTRERTTYMYSIWTGYVVSFYSRIILVVVPLCGLIIKISSAKTQDQLSRDQRPADET